MPHLIFDLDGTLSDPAVGIARSVNYALEALGFEPIDESSIDQYIGPPLDGTFRQIAATDDDATITALVAKYRERYADIGYKENVLYPGISEVVAKLAHNDVRLGVCTSKPDLYAGKILEEFGLRNFFEFVSGGGIGVRKGDQLAALLQRAQTDNSATMIGDRAVDVEAGKENGLRTIGVAWGFAQGDELIAAAPDRILEAPEKLATL